MTCTLIAAFIQDGILDWSTTIESVFPRAKGTPYAGVTVEMLLAHHSGLPANIDWYAIDDTLDIHKQRLDVVAQALAIAPIHPPGTALLYSNLGIVVAATMLEELMGHSWEYLIETNLFGPLGLTSIGYGPPDGARDPLGRFKSTGLPAQPHDKLADNPPVMSPAGRVHASLADLSRYYLFHLRGHLGTLPASAQRLTRETFLKLHSDPYGDGTCLGWFKIPQRNQTWAKGDVYTHSGSNTLWNAVVWMAPSIDMVIFAVTNDDINGASACNDAVLQSITMHQYCNEFSDKESCDNSDKHPQFKCRFKTTSSPDSAIMTHQCVPASEAYERVYDWETTPVSSHGTDILRAVGISFAALLVLLGFGAYKMRSRVNEIASSESASRHMELGGPGEYVFMSQDLDDHAR
jgi:CubicO group peptidase (beta-lactamase class C family)